jgi:hypothetical protein
LVDVGVETVADGDQGVVRDPGDVLTGGVGDVGGQEGVASLSHPGPQRVLSPVELVIA